MEPMLRSWWWAANFDEVLCVETIAPLRALFTEPAIEVVVATNVALAHIAEGWAQELRVPQVRVAPELEHAAQRARESLAANARASLLVVATPSTIAEFAGLALSSSTDVVGAVRPRLNSLSVIDWPPANDPDGRPSIIGLDLDWRPPPPTTRRTKFPGGPGSAPSARG